MAENTKGTPGKVACPYVPQVSAIIKRLPSVEKYNGERSPREEARNREIVGAVRSFLWETGLLKWMVDLDLHMEVLRRVAIMFQYIPPVSEMRPKPTRVEIALAIDEVLAEQPERKAKSDAIIGAIVEGARQEQERLGLNNHG